jgi:hypothetical protein
MSRLKLFGLALVAVFVLSALAAASALAAEASVLTASQTESNAVGFTAKATSTTTFSVLQGFITVKCSEIEAEGAQEGKTLLGSFHIHWQKCTTSGGATCTGTGDAAGSILALGHFHIVIVSKSPLTLGILFLLEQLHITCSGFLGTLLLVKGEVICGLTPLTLGSEKTIACRGQSGDAENISYFNEKGEEVKLGSEALLTSEGTGAFRMSALAGTQEHIKASQEVEFMD